MHWYLIIFLTLPSGGIWSGKVISAPTVLLQEGEAQCMAMAETLTGNGWRAKCVPGVRVE